MTTSGHGTSRGRGVQAGAPPTPREVELLAATLEELRESGYENLTVDNVAARAHASKATVYRRWPSKAELVAAAYAHGPRQAMLPPDTGTLRGDLLQLAEMISHDADLYAGAGLGILASPGSCAQLRKLLVDNLYQHRHSQVVGVLRRAVGRGEISPEAISEDIWDVLPGYLSYRAVMQPDRPVTTQTLHALVDELLIPSLTRRRPACEPDRSGCMDSATPEANPALHTE